MVTGEPAQRRVQGAPNLRKRVGIEAAVLGDVAGGENQVDPRLLPGDPLDHLLQAMGGIHAKQARAILGEQVAVRKLHQQYGGVGGGSVRMA